MDEVEYVVPPESIISGGSDHPKPPIKLHKKPNKALEWVKSHKILSIASVAMVGIISLVAVVMISGQPVSLFGFQLNPLYNSAAPCSPADCPILDEPNPDPGPNPSPSPTPTPTPGPVASPDGFQVTVRDEGCATQSATSALVTAGTSKYISDTNDKDPDCARISFSAGSFNSVPDTESIYTNDFRIGTRISESENGCTNQIDSSIKWTAWASEGGSTSSQAVAQPAAENPDCIWLHYETRPMPSGKGIRDARVGIASGGSTQFTPWARAGGGNSAFSSAGNIRPTTVTLEVQTITTSTPPPTLPVPGAISISGSIANGVVGQNTIAPLSVSGTAQTPCTWSLVSVTPSVAGATVVNSNSAGTNANFQATPTAAGTYQVAVLVTCQNGQVANSTIPWTVTIPPSNPAPSTGLIITGAFPAGTVGQAYTTTVRTSNKPVLSCSWTLVSVVPTINGSTVQISLTPTQGTSSLADFKSTPTAVGLYKVTISTNCGTAGTAQNTFDWVVGKVATTPGSGTNSNTCLDQATLGKLSAVYRFWSPAYGDHLYTTNPNEKPNGYRFEGVSGYVFAEKMANTVPIYRSAQREIGSHYYTTTDEDPTKYGYVNEGILGYAYANAVTGSTPWYRMHKGGEASDYVHTISEAEKSAIKELGYVDEGTVAHICGGSQPTELQPLFRLWGSGDRDHFYTTNFSERDSLLTRNYVSEGITGYIYGVRKEGSVPLHRSYSQAIGDHLYSASENEARSAGYNYEGVIGYISPTDNDKTTPIYRLYSPIMGDHFYTTSSTEAAAAIVSGYKGEGVTGYLYLSQ